MYFKNLAKENALKSALALCGKRKIMRSFFRVGLSSLGGMKEAKIQRMYFLIIPFNFEIIITSLPPYHLLFPPSNLLHRPPPHSLSNSRSLFFMNYCYIYNYTYIFLNA